MSSNTVIAFDFGTKSIGVAVGQTITGTARPLAALKAREGIPDWELIAAVFR
ncbi:Holliday junction resolvase, partial [Morganella morganii]